MDAVGGMIIAGYILSLVYISQEIISGADRLMFRYYAAFADQESCRTIFQCPRA
jgi:hypothetical protein